MNSYNENLHSAIVNSLQSLDIEEQNLGSQLNAAMFTLYHAEGATITAEQNLGAARDTFKFKTAVQNQAVKDNNVSVNVLSSATQASQYVKQSVTNIAVCAANVQIATNAIVRLSGDIGAIYSIVNAADFDSDIYFLADEVRGLMNRTAYDAEVASQLAMEASMLTAEVSASTVLDMAKTTNTLMGSVLKITTADFEAATQDIATDNAALASVRSTEKLDEGALELIAVDYNATKSAYDLANRELNLGLNVRTSEKNALTFTVDFNLMRSPFPAEKAVKGLLYPVEQYYLIVVKENKKQTFSISNAENLLLLENTQVISVDTPETVHVSQVVNVYTDLTGKHPATLRDSEGDEITPGVSYVVFVMAVFCDEYKRKINCYDDYLSAPSQAFTLSTRLVSIAGKTIQVSPFHKDHLSEEELDFANRLKEEQQLRSAADGDEDNAIADYTYVLTFDSTENPDMEVEYRCMLLPFSPDVSNRLLTSESLHFLVEKEISGLEEIANQFDPEIAKKQADNYTIELKLELLADELKELNEQLTAKDKDGGSAEPVEKQQSLKDAQKSVTAQIKELQKSHDANVKLIDYLKEEKDKTVNALAEVDAAKPGFLFNVPIAEQVYADSYTVARKKKDTKDSNSSQWIAFFGPDATDNFGNRLNGKEKYLPVILSYSTAAAENKADFVNALSDMSTTSYFPD